MLRYAIERFRTLVAANGKQGNTLAETEKDVNTLVVFQKRMKPCHVQQNYIISLLFGKLANLHDDL